MANPTSLANSFADDIELTNIVEPVSTDIIASLCDALPQINYVGFSLYSILIPQLLAAIQASLILPQPAGVGIAWNAADAALQIIGGGLQIYTAVKGNTHQPISMGLEGGANIASGVQLITLTALSASLGGIGFAVAFGVASLCSLKSSATTVRKYADDTYWFRDNLEIIELLNKNYQKQQNEEKKLAEMLAHAYQHNADFQSLALLEFVYYLIKEKRETLEQLQQDVFARLVTDYVKKGKNSYLISQMTTDDHFKNLTSAEASCLKKIRTKDAEEKETQSYSSTHENTESDRLDVYRRIQLKTNQPSYANCLNRENQIKDEMRTESIGKSIDTLFIFCAFAGMVCLCSPVTLPAAPFFIAAAVGYFTGKFCEKGVSMVPSVFSFFNDIRNRQKTSSSNSLEDVLGNTESSTYSSTTP